MPHLPLPPPPLPPPPSPSSPSPPLFVAPRPDWQAQNVLRFVHIGKCGGTTIGSWLKSAKRQFVGSAASNYHEHHLNRDYGSAPSNFVVWVRDPIARFRSAYDYELSVFNAPVPEHPQPGWSCTLGPDCPAPKRVRNKAATGHAYPVAFEEQLLHFDSANHLAESIYASGDDGEIARALMVDMNEHIAKGIGWYLFDGDFVRTHHRRTFVGSVERMDEDRLRLAKLLGLEVANQQVQKLRSTAHDTDISAHGLLNLRRWYNKTDYAALRELVRYGLLDPALYDLEQESAEAEGDLGGPSVLAPPPPTASPPPLASPSRREARRTSPPSRPATPPLRRRGRPPSRGVSMRRSSPLTLSQQWAAGQPSSKLEEAGVLIHVADGGQTPHNQDQMLEFIESVAADRLWAEIASGGSSLPHHRSFLSVSIINSAHPVTFQVAGRWTRLGVHDDMRKALADYSFMPSFVLNATAFQDRVSCCYSTDGWSNDHLKARLPGCPDEWGRNSFPRDRLAECLQQQDVPATFVGPYNEIVLNFSLNPEGMFERGTHPVLALFVDVRASGLATDLARSVQTEARLHGVALALLTYNETRGPPFAVSRCGEPAQRQGPLAQLHWQRARARHVAQERNNLVAQFAQPPNALRSAIV